MNSLERLLTSLSHRSPNQVNDADRPQAAVAVLLVANPDRLLLIRRAERESDPWSGHLALPGGRRDETDVNLLATAIRETAEETGIVLHRDQCCAVLDDLAPRTPVLPPIMVRPFVFQLDEATAPQLSEEVAFANWLELERLTAPGVLRPATIEIHGIPRAVEGYHLDEGLLWGMTERILSPIIKEWQGLRATNT